MEQDQNASSVDQLSPTEQIIRWVKVDHRRYDALLQAAEDGPGELEELVRMMLKGLDDEDGYSMFLVARDVRARELRRVDWAAVAEALTN